MALRTSMTYVEPYPDSGAGRDLRVFRRPPGMGEIIGWARDMRSALTLLRSQVKGPRWSCLRAVPGRPGPRRVPIGGVLIRRCCSGDGVHRPAFRESRTPAVRPPTHAARAPRRRLRPEGHCAPPEYSLRTSALRYVVHRGSTSNSLGSDQARTSAQDLRGDGFTGPATASAIQPLPVDSIVADRNTAPMWKRSKVRKLCSGRSHRAASCERRRGQRGGTVCGPLLELSTSCAAAIGASARSAWTTRSRRARKGAAPKCRGARSRFPGGGGPPDPQRTAEEPDLRVAGAARTPGSRSSSPAPERERVAYIAADALPGW